MKNLKIFGPAIFMAFTSMALASPLGYTSVQVGTGTCFYVSNTPMYPYNPTSSSDPTIDYAALECQKLGLDLAVILNDAERKAIWNLINCKMTPYWYAVYIRPSSYTGLTSSNGACSVLIVGGNFFTSNQIQYCNGSIPSFPGCTDWEGQSVPCTNSPPSFVCRKNATCSKQLSLCYTSLTGQISCFIDFGLMSWTDGNKLCQSRGGSLPVIRDSNKYSFMEKNFYKLFSFSYWIALKCSDSTVSFCMGSGCLTPPNLYWMKQNNTSSLLIQNDLVIQIGAMQGKNTCFGQSLIIEKWNNEVPCSDSTTYKAVCEFEGSRGSPTDPPDAFDNKMVCTETLKTPTAASKMVLVQNSVPMCANTTATFACGPSDYGFQNDLSKSVIAATCNPNTLLLNYNYTLWPTCESIYNCSVPPLDSSVMIYDWSPAVGLRPGFSVIYTCLDPLFKLVLKASPNGTATSMGTICLDSGSYSVDITLYTCLNPLATSSTTYTTTTTMLLSSTTTTAQPASNTASTTSTTTTTMLLSSTTASTSSTTTTKTMLLSSTTASTSSTTASTSSTTTTPSTTSIPPPLPMISTDFKIKKTAGSTENCASLCQATCIEGVEFCYFEQHHVDTPTNRLNMLDKDLYIYCTCNKSKMQVLPGVACGPQSKCYPNPKDSWVDGENTDPKKVDNIFINQMADLGLLPWP